MIVWLLRISSSPKFKTVLTFSTSCLFVWDIWLKHTSYQLNVYPVDFNGIRNLLESETLSCMPLSIYIYHRSTSCLIICPNTRQHILYTVSKGYLFVPISNSCWMTFWLLQFSSSPKYKTVLTFSSIFYLFGIFHVCNHNNCLVF